MPPNTSDSNNGSFRNSFDDVLLENKLRSAILRINPNIDAKTQDEVLGIVKRVDSSEVISSNESFHSMMTNDVNVIMRKDDEDRGDYIKLIDFDNPDSNEFTVVNQFTVTYNNQRKRPDVILFVNGIPLVALELKTQIMKTLL